MNKCSECQHATRKEKVWWVCKKNCVHRNEIDTCMWTPIQFEPVPLMESKINPLRNPDIDNIRKAFAQDIIEMINRYTPEMEEKRLRITVSELCQLIKRKAQE